ncbi:MAG: molecular chaperone DnaK [Cognaticolwellia sp.]|jgi:molecular chaperone DnaK
MSRTIGIDLGTTNTVVAVFDNGRPRVLEDGKGYKVLPSVVYQKDDGTFVVGQAAKSHVLTSPDRAVYAIKRLMGRRYDSQQAASAVERMPYGIERAPEGGCLVSVGGQLLSPVELSAIILQVARQIAEESLGEEITNAVITVPAYFNHAQRQATLQAAGLAGLNCERLINEPTAAALAYGFRKDDDRNVLIFDLGGGTFDVSILHLSDGVYEVLATSGDTYLGGEDFDDRVVEFLADRFMAEHRIDLRQDRTARQRLKDAAERAKCELSFTEKTRLLVPRITPELNLEDTLSRTDLEGLVEDLVQRTLDIAKEAVNSAGLSIAVLDDVVLVGGQTRMPRVREAISALFRKEPSKSVHPEEVVALGASVHAQSLDTPSQKSTLLIDVTPFDLGIDAAGGYFSKIIERNTRIPFTATRAFTTASENQERARITVRQGGSNRAKENEQLGQFILDRLSGGASMEHKVDVTFRIDANGILHTAAVDRASGDRKILVIDNYVEMAQSPNWPPKIEGDGSEAYQPVTAERTEKLRAEGGILSGFFANFGRKSQDEPNRMELKTAESAPLPEGAFPVEEHAPIDSPPDLEDSAPEEEDVGDPVSLDLSNIDFMAGEEENSVDQYSILPEDEPASIEPLINLAHGLPKIDLPDMLAGDLSQLEGLDPFAEGAAHEDEPMPEIPDLPLPRMDASGDMDDPFSGLGEDIFGDDVIEEMDAIRPGSLKPNLSDSLDHWEGQGRSQELGDLSLDEGLDLGLDEEPLRPALLEEDLFSAGDLFGAFPGQVEQEERTSQAPPSKRPMPAAEQEPKLEPKKTRAPARLKMNYRSRRAFVREYRDNLERGSTFIKAAKPLREGRQCVFEIRAPGLPGPIALDGLVTWSSRKRQLGASEESGMSIEYRMVGEQRENLLRALKALDER